MFLTLTSSNFLDPLLISNFFKFTNVKHVNITQNIKIAPLTVAGSSICSKLISRSTRTCEGTTSVYTGLRAIPIIHLTFIYVCKTIIISIFAFVFDFFRSALVHLFSTRKVGLPFLLFFILFFLPLSTYNDDIKSIYFLGRLSKDLFIFY